jgi:hypothetical protein
VIPRLAGLLDTGGFGPADPAVSALGRRTLTRLLAA